jgi:hypothetical protein
VRNRHQIFKHQFLVVVHPLASWLVITKPNSQVTVVMEITTAIQISVATPMRFAYRLQARTATHRAAMAAAYQPFVMAIVCHEIPLILAPAMAKFYAIPWHLCVDQV